MWQKKKLSKEEANEIDVVDLIKEATPFFPCMRRALIILSSLPPTTATVERSFSTLRKKLGSGHYGGGKAKWLMFDERSQETR